MVTYAVRLFSLSRMDAINAVVTDASGKLLYRNVVVAPWLLTSGYSNSNPSV